MFIDEWFGERFYKKLQLGYYNEASFCFGQIFWAHAYYPHENLELWRPVPELDEPTKTIASQFRITAAVRMHSNGPCRYKSRDSKPTRSSSSFAQKFGPWS